MKAMTRRSTLKGASLIEVLMSLVIGLMVVGAVMVSMMGAGQAGKFQSALAQMNEDAQIALSILSRDLQMAGYSRPTGLVPAISPAGTQVMGFTFAALGTSPFVLGCDTGFANPGNASTCGTAATSAIEVTYEADKDNTVLTDGVPTNCLGNKILEGPPYVTRNRFFISTGAAGRPELSCASQTLSEPLVENIENMKIWYGTSVAAKPTQVVRYVTATQIATLGAGAALEWGRVISVRVCLLVRSAEPVLNAGGEDTLGYLDCDASPQISNDRRLRRAYFTTATLRDKMP
jgi:type IV pilus assembly protein PilW